MQVGLVLIALAACGAERSPDVGAASPTPAPPETPVRPTASPTIASDAAPEAPSAAPNTIEVDGVEFGSLQGPGPASASWTTFATNEVIRFQDADELSLSGLIDVSKTGPLQRGRTTRTTFRTQGKTLPALVLRARTQDGEDGAGSEELLFLDARTGRQLLRFTVERHEAGGYGGFSLGSLRVEAKGSNITLHGTHQERLPERRKRCMRPKPYAVSFQWDGTRFIKQESLDVSRGGC